MIFALQEHRTTTTTTATKHYPKLRLILTKVYNWLSPCHIKVTYGPYSVRTGIYEEIQRYPHDSIYHNEIVEKTLPGRGDVFHLVSFEYNDGLENVRVYEKNTLKYLLVNMLVFVISTSQAVQTRGSNRDTRMVIHDSCMAVIVYILQCP